MVSEQTWIWQRTNTSECAGPCNAPDHGMHRTVQCTGPRNAPDRATHRTMEGTGPCNTLDRSLHGKMVHDWNFGSCKSNRTLCDGFGHRVSDWMLSVAHSTLPVVKPGLGALSSSPEVGERSSFWAMYRNPVANGLPLLKISLILSSLFVPWRSTFSGGKPKLLLT